MTCQARVEPYQVLRQARVEPYQVLCQARVDVFFGNMILFLKKHTLIVGYITFDFHHHFPKKLYGTLDEIKLYDLILINQGFH